jgi:type IV pilus assembly protein PilY1
VVSATAFGASKILWEFSEANDAADMGYVISYPHIARMRDGTWVAIFGNGYDSANGQAVLFILDLSSGTVIKKISVGTAGGNGLSQPNFTVNSNREVTAIYAGDLKGSLWKFDVSSDSRADWTVAFSGTPLFRGDTKQPITVMPEIAFHPSGGTMVSFGTGKLFDVEDTATTLPTNVNLNTQALYGIWDKTGETSGLTDTTKLVLQTANSSLAAAADPSLKGTTSNTVDWSTKRGWYMNLASGGERVNVNPQQVKNVLLMVANTPNSDLCKAGGASRLFALDPVTGGAPDFGVFDANASGGISTADKGYNVKSITYAVMSLPTLQSKKPVADTVTTESQDSRGQTGARLGGVENKPINPTDCDRWLLAGGSDTTIVGFDISVCNKNKPRISWRQLR